MLLWACYAHDHVSRTSFSCCIASVSPSMSATLCFFFLSRCRVIHLRVVPYLAGRATDFSMQWVVTTGRPQETCQDKSRVQNFMQALRCRRSAWCETQASVERHCLSGQGGGTTPSHPDPPICNPCCQGTEAFSERQNQAISGKPASWHSAKTLDINA